MSFWVVPWSWSSGTPCSSAATMYSASSQAAVALIVIDVFIWSSGMPSSSVAHVALVRDRDADLADLAAGELVVGVIAGLGRQVERDRQARLALLQVAPVQLVRAPRVRVARVCPHHPRAIGLGQARRWRLRHGVIVWRGVWSRPCPIKAQLPPSTPSCRRSPRRWRRSRTIWCRKSPTCISRSRCGATTASPSTRT